MTADTIKKAEDTAPPPPQDSPTPPSGKAPKRPADLVFEFLSTFSGSLILAILAAVFFFLLVQGFPAFLPDAAHNSEFIEKSTNIANPDGEGNFFWYVLPLVFGTLWASLLALIISVPIAILVALFITHYAPRKLAATLGYVIDLLAAVPSVVFGLWGATVLGPFVAPFYAWLNSNVGWLPLFSGDVSSTGRTILTAAIVLAVMILPIITSLTREVFLQTPRLHEEAALALGATRWEMVKMSVLPFARSGMVSSVMLGLGRALGETMAVAMVLSASGVITFQLTSSTNPSTIAANIALSFPEASGLDINVLIASGLVLFAITLIVNSIARWIVSRRSQFSGAN
ncbi:phosphate ABC transporter permease subunit PstC [Pseudoclavibacter chungangensis]|uniref:Phosphate transport system permease protein n=1 Tax=Pseudoclavibacter chungangensis TaxID=587635 RepID=A0A7J5C0N7_9MICO|nr:phosphate ABC transporter permease subunit PstC [Pseudoclavibacter chungangensis]KAB1660328.1 phosphate ABC transporter permease subunit PstC [Pseudoclavibacter chungangensis]NYJ65684.1 phosphate transport system permease protein [Pseudoclavibacter chungangensis]